MEQRTRHGRQTEPDHEGPARGARSIRRDGDQEGPADGHDGGGPGPALHVSPLCRRVARAGGAAPPAIGGQDYIYAFRGDARTPTTWVPAAQQRAALQALMATLKPSELALPKTALDKIPPRPSGWGRDARLFARPPADAFDPISPASIAADVTIGFTLQPDRAARMVAQHAVDPSLPGLTEVVDALRTATFQATTSSPYEEESRGG